MTKHKVLWIGDAAVDSGFGRCTRRILDGLSPRYDLAVLGIGYTGEPHDDPRAWPWPIYPAVNGGDAFGVRRTAELVTALRPSVVVIQQDAWNFPAYLREIADVPTVGVVAVDGLNCRGAALNGLTHAIFWTRFGEQQAKLGGYHGPSSVVPLGVDAGIYRAWDRTAARAALRLDEALPEGAFVVLNVNRNQMRKRMDLTVAYFAEWMRSRDVRDAYLLLHCAPTGDSAFDLPALVNYFGIANRVQIRSFTKPGRGVPEARLAQLYSAADLLLTTSMAEGFGLTTLEAMACGTATAGPDCGGLADWAGEAMATIPCPTFMAAPGRSAAIWGVPDQAAAVETLDNLYRDESLRHGLEAAGAALAARPEHAWPAVAAGVEAAIEQALHVGRLVGAPA